MIEGASPMHLTKSIDYAIVLDGEIEMHLDDGSCTVLQKGALLPVGETLTRKGDIIIQRGTNHKWVKPHGTAVKFLVCLIDGGNLGVVRVC